MGLECDFTPYELFKKREREVRKRYTHSVCKSVTELTDELAGAFARNPNFLDLIYCVDCHGHYPARDFVWEGTTEKVGT